MRLEVVAGLDEQVANAACAEGLTDQADRPVGQFLEGAGFLTDARQLVEGVQAVAECSLCGRPMQQFRAQPEVGQRDAADARDRLQEVQIVLFAARGFRPLEMEDARQPVRHAER